MTQNCAEQAEPEITCREVAEWTSAYLDEHLHEPTKVRMAMHLVTCAGCRAYVDQIASVQKILRSLPVQAVEPALLGRLWQAYKTQRKD
jgi:predicted anti-sigma-YlaC factor YlaD